MAGETIEYKVTLDATQAQAGLDAVRRSAESMGGGLEAASAKAGKFQEAAAKMKEGLEKQAAAFAVLSQAMGNSNDTVSKTIAGVGQLAAAYGAGGPLAVALLAGGAAVQKLTQHWEDLTAAQDKALSSQFSAADKAIAESKKMQAEIARLRKEQGIDVESPASLRAETERQREQVNARITELRAQLRKVDATTEENRVALTGELKQLIAQAEEGGLLDRLLSLRIAAIVKAQEKAAPKIQAAGAKGKAPLFEYDAGDMSGAALDAALAAPTKAELESKKKLEDAKTRYQREQSGFRMKDHEREHQHTMALLEKQAEREKQLADERERQAKQAADVAQTMAAAIGDFAAQAMTGQEDAFKNFLSAASRQTGGFIQLKGGELIAQGVASSLAGNPAGVGQIAGGLTLVTAGAAVATAGPAAIGNMLGQTGSGAPSGAPSARTERGTSGRSSQSGGGGGTVINITYGGISGPDADRGADAVERAMKRAKRRGVM